MRGFKANVKNSTKYLSKLNNVQSLLIMQQAVVIQCSYNAIQYLATILSLAAIFNFTTMLFLVFHGTVFMKW